MSVTEVKQALGSWEVRLRADTPRAILDQLTYFGHVALLPGRIDPSALSDNVLAAARYVGVYRRRAAGDDYTMRGSGMAYWLGDEEDKGDIHETAVSLVGATFAQTVNALLPPSGSIIPGVINSVPGTYNGKHQWVTPRKALDYAVETFGAEYRVNNNGTLDAGTISQLYATTPKAILMNREAGRDLHRLALSGKLAMETDVEDYTTRVVLLAEGEGSNIATGTASHAIVPYRDLRGNPVKLTRLVSESETSALNANARAQIQLNRFTGKRSAVSLSTETYDVKGDVSVGDYIDVYDPDRGFVDPSREVIWEGQPINPMALRCVEMSWPIPAGWTVAFRTTEGAWIDLSQYYVGESGDTSITVGELNRSLGGGGEPVGVRPNLPDSPDGAPDTTIPAAPVWGDFSTGSYQPDSGEWTRAAVFASWSQPLNTDGSVITDGGHYEIRYRQGNYIGYTVRWGQLNVAGYKWGDLSGNRWGAPISEPVQASGEWHTVFVGWGQTQTLIPELTPGLEYEFQIRAVDNNGNRGPWSASHVVLASEDLFAPDVPAAPVVASSRIAIQVIHALGKASGGTFNLPPDLVYLSVHVGGSSSFFPDDTNEVGKLIANAAMIQAHVPAVGTFQIEQTDAVWVRLVAVDRAGNKSGPSEAVQATADLIDNAHISDLSVSKLTAGVITAQTVLASQMEVGLGGNIKLTDGSLDVYKPDGTKMVEAGLLSNGAYGLAAVDSASGELVDIATLAFGIRAASVTTAGTLSGSGSFRDITGNYGPEVTVTVGNSGRCLVTVSAEIEVDLLKNLGLETGAGYAGFQMVRVSTGAVVLSSNNTRAAGIELTYDTEGAVMTIPSLTIGSASTRVNLVTGLAPGDYVVTMKYFNISRPAVFRNRTLIVQPF